MTNRIFSGNDGDWFDANNWTPVGIPVAGDALVLSSGTATLSGTEEAAYGTLNDEQLTIGGITGDVATLDAADASFGSNFSIVSTSTSGDALMELTGTSSFAGSLTADAAGGDFAIEQASQSDLLILSGSITVGNGDALSLDGGTIVENGDLLVNGGTLVIDAGTTIRGSGTIVIANDGVVQIAGPVPAGLTFDFLDATGTLDLLTPQTFKGTVTNFQKGDEVAFNGWPARTVTYSAPTSTVAVYESGGNSPVVATFLLNFAANQPSQVAVAEDNNGGSFLTVSAERTWLGAASGDWYTASNWSTSDEGITNSYPVAGDMALIATGTAVVTASDSQLYGILDNEEINLTGNGSGFTVTDAVLGANLVIDMSAQNASASVGAAGTTTLSGVIAAAGLDAQLSVVTTNAGSDPGHLTVAIGGSIDDGSESALTLSGWVTNNGTVSVAGQTTFAAGSTVDGAGLILLNGTLTVYGRVGADERLNFSPSDDPSMGDIVLAVGQGAEMDGQIQNFSSADTIDMQGVVANAASYDASSGVLSLTENGAVVAQLNMSGHYVAQDFTVTSDGADGSFVTNTAPTSVVMTEIALPVSAEVDTGGTVSLIDLLDEAFGPSFLASHPKIAIQGIGQRDMSDYFSYWNPQDPSISAWVVNGNTVTPDQLQPLSVADLSNTYLVAGDQIRTALTIAVANAFDSNGNVTGYTDYEVLNLDPEFSTAPTDAAPTPQDVVNAASAFAAAYTDVPNTNDCYYIARSVAAASGAVMGSSAYNTDPTKNLASGFWRIAYAAGVTQPAVSNWSALVQAGDIMRIGWDGTNGPHSFTVLGPVDSSGNIPVFDNGYSASGYSAIGISSVSYWNETNPDLITIFRLDSSGYYLVDGVTTNHALIQGTSYDDIILPQGSADTISTSLGDDIIAGSTAVLNDATITDFCSADTIDLTGFDPMGTELDYDPLTGLLDVSGAGSSISICLPTGLVGDWTVTNDGGSANLDGDTLGTLYSDLYNGLDVGADITLVTCFASGTCIATPRGDIPVEALEVGESVCLADGSTQEISWIGQRHINMTRHPQPDRVLPVRVAASAFGTNMPRRDLLLSPDHAVFLSGVLIPVKYLINDQSIRQLTCAEMPQVLYWHIELPEHDVLLAENLPVESYLDTGNRNNFSNGGQSVDLFPDFAPLVWDARGYAPLHVTGPAVEKVRALLQMRGVPAAAAA